MTQNSLDVFVQIEKKFGITADGVGSVSKKGLDRLTGVSRKTWGQGGSIFTKKIDQFLAENGVDLGSIFTPDGRSNPKKTVLTFLPKK